MGLNIVLLISTCGLAEQTPWLGVNGTAARCSRPEQPFSLRPPRVAAAPPAAGAAARLQRLLGPPPIGRGAWRGQRARTCIKQAPVVAQGPRAHRSERVRALRAAAGGARTVAGQWGAPGAARRAPAGRDGCPSRAPGRRARARAEARCCCGCALRLILACLCPAGAARRRLGCGTAAGRRAGCGPAPCGAPRLPLRPATPNCAPGRPAALIPRPPGAAGRLAGQLRPGWAAPRRKRPRSPCAQRSGGTTAHCRPRCCCSRARKPFWGVAALFILPLGWFSPSITRPRW